MPRPDRCHSQIVHAFQKDGWRIISEQEQYYAPERAIFVDIKAGRNVNGSTQQILLAEVKCFPDRDSTSRELYVSFGQYVIYRAVLAELRDSSPLYLTVPEDVYIHVFDSTVRRAISDNHIKLVIVNLETEAITQWIE
jgi:hypothetical protein